MKKSTIVATLIDINHASKFGEIQQRHIDKCQFEIEWAVKNKILTQTGAAQWELTPLGKDWCNVVLISKHPSGGFLVNVPYPFRHDKIVDCLNILATWENNPSMGKGWREFEIKDIFDKNILTFGVWLKQTLNVINEELIVKLLDSCFEEYDGEI